MNKINKILLATLIGAFSSSSLAVDNLYLELKCEENTTVKVILKPNENKGWAEIKTPKETRKADYMIARGDDAGGGTLYFASKGIGFQIDYTSKNTYKLTYINAYETPPPLICESVTSFILP